MTNRFVEFGGNETRWEFDTEFRCTGLLKIMALLMPEMFRRASLKEMISFKTFAKSSAIGACAEPRLAVPLGTDLVDL